MVQNTKPHTFTENVHILYMWCQVGTVRFNAFRMTVQSSRISCSESIYTM